MLFRKKDNSDSAKAKTSFFSRSAKKVVSEHKKEAPISSEQSSDTKSSVLGSSADSKESGRIGKKADKRSVKQTVAAGKVDPNILLRPRITEKATHVSAYNVYVFDVAPHANKGSVNAAVRDVYGVVPVKVRIVSVPAKSKRGRRGQKSVLGGGKKAYVYLKEGDTIELV